jgi:hypothetical protein
MDDTSKAYDNKIRLGNFSLDGRSHKTGDAAFIPATPQDLKHSRANTSSHKSHNAQNTRLTFMQKGAKPRKK